MLEVCISWCLYNTFITLYLWALKRLKTMKNVCNWLDFQPNEGEIAFTVKSREDNWMYIIIMVQTKFCLNSNIENGWTLECLWISVYLFIGVMCTQYITDWANYKPQIFFGNFYSERAKICEKPLFPSSQIFIVHRIIVRQMRPLLSSTKNNHCWIRNEIWIYVEHSAIETMWRLSAKSIISVR